MLINVKIYNDTSILFDDLRINIIYILNLRLLTV